MLDEIDADSRVGRWGETPERSASTTLRWRADPAPTLKALQKATRTATKAAKAAVPPGGRLEVAADVKPGRAAGSLGVIVQIKVRGPGFSARTAVAPAEAFAAAFERAIRAPAELRRVSS